MYQEIFALGKYWDITYRISKWINISCPIWKKKPSLSISIHQGKTSITRCLFMSINHLTVLPALVDHQLTCQPSTISFLASSPPLGHLLPLFPNYHLHFWSLFFFSFFFFFFFFFFFLPIWIVDGLKWFHSRLESGWRVLISKPQIREHSFFLFSDWICRVLVSIWQYLCFHEPV